MDSRGLKSGEFEWIRVDWTQENSDGFTWIGVRRIRVDSRRFAIPEFGWIHFDWSQMN